MSSIWNAILDAFEALLGVLHDVLEPVFGVHAWGWAIILLTVVVRLVLMPLAVKQTRSMRAMQELSPRIKAIQKKYPTDREMLRSDPEKYRARKAKVNEETMALYRDAGVNPAAGCLPLLAQMPIFFALFSVLRGSAEIADEPFYFFTDQVNATSDAAGLGANGSAAGWPAILLIVLMAGTMFITQRQVMGRNAAMSEGPQAQQQKIIMYVMPVMLAFFGFNLPLGVLLYWVTTNVWQMGQQYYIYRDLGPVPSSRDADERGGKGAGSNGKGKASGSRTTDKARGKDHAADGRANGKASRGKASRGKQAGGKQAGGKQPGDQQAGGKPSRGKQGGKGGSTHLPGRRRSAG